MLTTRVQDVTKVLIAGEWYRVEEGSFQIRDQEFDDPNRAGSSDRLTNLGRCFGFKSEVHDGWVSGPLASIQAFVLREGEEAQ